MAIIAQLVRASDCGSECRGFESRWSPFFLLNLLVKILLSWHSCGLTAY